jgi:hypothetical protein
MANRADIPRTTSAEIEQLIRQIRGANLNQGAKDKIERLLCTVLILVELLQRKNTSIKKAPRADLRPAHRETSLEQGRKRGQAERIRASCE